MIEKADTTPLTPALARDILSRVGEIGQPPEVGIEHLNVGNEKYLSILEKEYLLPMATERRGSTFKLVQAYFGGGKTHFLYCVRSIAWRHGFASAMVGLSPDECPFDDPVRIYRAVADETAWPPRDPTVPPSRGLDSALRTAIEERVGSDGEDEVAQWIETELRQASVDAPSYRNAFSRYAMAVLEGDMDAQDVLGAYLRAEDVTLAELRPFGVREQLSRSSGFRFIRSLCQCLQVLGVPGLLLAFDELDRNLSLPPRRRRAVADNLRQLIDLCGREALPGLMCLYAAPPEFMRNVVVEYPALQQRLEGPSTLSERSPQAAVIDLENLDLEALELLQAIGERILSLFETAYSRGLDTELQTENMNNLAREVMSSSFEVAHRRAFVKAAVDLLHRQSVQETPLSPDDLRELAGKGAEIVSLDLDSGFEAF